MWIFCRRSTGSISGRSTPTIDLCFTIHDNGMGMAITKSLVDLRMAEQGVKLDFLNSYNINGIIVPDDDEKICRSIGRTIFHTNP